MLPDHIQEFLSISAAYLKSATLEGEPTRGLQRPSAPDKSKQTRPVAKDCLSAARLPC